MSSSWAINKIRTIRRWWASRNRLIGERNLLSPRILNPNDKDDEKAKIRYVAVEELRDAINSENCNNIAVTGVYGSGKSSVIETCIAELPWYKRRKVLRISLSNFLNANNEKKDLEYEKQIEQKIFQHILFKTNQTKTRQTHYQRISHWSVQRGIWIAFVILLTILSLTILIKPEWILLTNHIRTLYVDSLPSPEVRHKIHLWVDIMALVYLAFVFIRISAYFVRRYHHFHLKGIKTEHVELEWGNDSTPFDKLLDEILYFFKAADCNIVIFEDLDRLKSPDQLFLKLREINMLLNESDYFRRWNKRIKFIYAIRDDVFEGEIRTKSFDYIIPVIPVVDKYNAGDYLINKYHGSLMKDVQERELAVLGMFIGGKRELTNIVNEFSLYYDTFINAEERSATKLLALLVYKNAYPQDYAKAYSKEGCLYSVFNNKKKFYEPLIKDWKEEVDKISKAINNAEQNIHSMRQQILAHLEADNIIKLEALGKEHPIEEFVTNDALYYAFEHDKISHYIFQDDLDYAKTKYDKHFSELLTREYTQEEYERQMANYQANIMKYSEEREQLTNKINIEKKKTLQGLITELQTKQASGIFSSICQNAYGSLLQAEQEQKCKDNASLLYAFIRSGYITEDYATYMSHMYAGSLTENDFRFINAVLQGKVLSYSYTIDNYDAVIRRLSSENFESKACLNINLLDYMLQHNRYQALLNSIIQVARKEPDFIVRYMSNGNRTKKFAEKLFDSWDDAINQISQISKDELRIVVFNFYWQTLPTSIVLSDVEKSILEEMYEYLLKLDGKKDIERIKQYLIHYQLKFKSLISPTSSTQPIYDYVIKNNYFEINIKNLHVIYGDEFNQASYTQVMNGDCDVSSYLNNNINVFLSILPDTDTKETPEAIVSLINRGEGDVELLKKFIARQTNPVNVAQIKNDEYLSILMQYNLVIPTWENVDNMYSRVETDDELVAYILNNREKLIEKKCETSQAHELEKLLLIDTELNSGEYESFATCFTETISAEEIGELPEEKLRVLNTKNLLEFDDATITTIKNTCSLNMMVEYLQHHFGDFISYGEMPIDISQEISIGLLNSSLTLEQKKQFMEQYPFSIKGESSEEYARLYCFYYEMIGDFEGADLTALVNAMKIYQDKNSWFIKISIINKVNATMPYNRTLEKALLETLGGEYLKLNKASHLIANFEGNYQNRELLNFLKMNKHYVSRIIPTSNGNLKVTFKHK